MSVELEAEFVPRTRARFSGRAAYGVGNDVKLSHCPCPVSITGPDTSRIRRLRCTMPEPSMAVLGPSAWRETHAATLRRLHAAADAARWDVSDEAWADTLYASASHRFPQGAPAREVREYLESLHHADLALARACRDGHGPAWDHFVLAYRPALYATARAIAGDEGRDLADALYAELYGLAERDGERRSLFVYFHGRSRLATWLRSVLVQRQIDRHRSAKRLEPLDPEDARLAAPPPRATEPQPGDFERQHFVRLTQEALDAAIAALDVRDRLRLRLYYGEDLSLVQIGRVTGESEATVSRKLERARRDLRRLVEGALKREHGLSDSTIAECFELAADAPELQLTRLLTRAEDG
jgi:RNA polymerase sigma-70 factor (ECF subfamily)